MKAPIDPSKLDGLTEEERKGLESLSGGKQAPKAGKRVTKTRTARNGVKSGFNVDGEKEEAIPRSKYDLEIGNLNEGIRDLKEKNGKLHGELKDAKKDAASASKAKEALEKKLSTLQGKYEDLENNGKAQRTKIADLQGKVDAFSKAQGPNKDSETIADLRGKVEKGEKDYKTLEKTLRTAETSCSDLEGKLKEAIGAKETAEAGRTKAENDLAEALATIEQLNARTVEPAEPPVTVATENCTITRISATQFQSDRFRDGRYTVILTKDGSTLTFRPDVTGSAECVDKTIPLPMLPKYVPFTTRKSFIAVRNDSGTMTIRL